MYELQILLFLRVLRYNISRMSYQIGARLRLHWHLTGRKRFLKILKLGKVFRDLYNIRKRGSRKDFISV